MHSPAGPPASGWSRTLPESNRIPDGRYPRVRQEQGRAGSEDLNRFREVATDPLAQKIEEWLPVTSCHNLDLDSALEPFGYRLGGQVQQSEFLSFQFFPLAEKNPSPLHVFRFRLHRQGCFAAERTKAFYSPTEANKLLTMHCGSLKSPENSLI